MTTKCWARNNQRVLDIRSYFSDNYKLVLLKKIIILNKIQAFIQKEAIKFNKLRNTILILLIKNDIAYNIIKIIIFIKTIFNIKNKKIISNKTSWQIHS